MSSLYNLHLKNHNLEGPSFYQPLQIGVQLLDKNHGVLCGREKTLQLWKLSQVNGFFPSKECVEMKRKKKKHLPSQELIICST